MRAAFWYSSLAEHHNRSLFGYSLRVGMGITATSWWRETRRLDLVVLDVVVGQSKVPSEVCVKDGTMTLAQMQNSENFMPDNTVFDDNTRSTQETTSSA